MADSDNDEIESAELCEFEDPVSSRAIAAVQVARQVDVTKDDAAKAYLLQMMNKLNRSIKAVSEAEVRSIQGGKA
jgi:hypothetical protein